MSEEMGQDRALVICTLEGLMEEEKLSWAQAAGGRSPPLPGGVSSLHP